MGSAAVSSTPADPGTSSDSDPVIAALRSAGCVFAEEEAAILRSVARAPGELAALLDARVGGQPLEQLVGFVEFGGLRLSVGPGVFVPRQRTRLLAAAAIGALASRARPIFVEAFAGVAPVAAAVQAALPGAEIQVTERDQAALVHARQNLPEGAGIHAGEVLEPLPGTLRGRVDVIAAVPPYVPSGAASLLPREARGFEPEEALFGGDDGLVPTRALIGQARRWLAADGRLLVELNEAQLDAAIAQGRACGFDARIFAEADSQTAVLELAAR